METEHCFESDRTASSKMVTLHFKHIAEGAKHSKKLAVRAVQQKVFKISCQFIINRVGEALVSSVSQQRFNEIIWCNDG